MPGLPPVESPAICPFWSDDRYSFAAHFPLPLLKAIRGVLTGPELNWFWPGALTPSMSAHSDAVRWRESPCKPTSQPTFAFCVDYHNIKTLGGTHESRDFQRNMHRRNRAVCVVRGSTSPGQRWLQ